MLVNIEPYLNKRIVAISQREQFVYRSEGILRGYSTLDLELEDASLSVGSIHIGDTKPSHLAERDDSVTYFIEVAKGRKQTICRDKLITIVESL